MTIKFKGYLNNDGQLKKLTIEWIDYLFVFLIILYPLIKSIKLLISNYNGKLLNVFLMGMLGFIIVILLIMNTFMQ